MPPVAGGSSLSALSWSLLWLTLIAPAHCVTHPPACQVRGRQLDSEGGVRTRKQAAAAGGGPSHTTVSADVKIIMVLADQLADLQVGAGGSTTVADLQLWNDDTE